MYAYFSVFLCMYSIYMCSVQRMRQCNDTQESDRNGNELMNICVYIRDCVFHVCLCIFPCIPEKQKRTQ